MEIFFDALATFPNAKVLITPRDPLEWAATRRERHPTDKVPLLTALGFQAPLAAVSVEQAAAAQALWHRVVAGSVPPERLLVLDVWNTLGDELWARLAGFVGRPLPARDDEGNLPPFPHQRYAADVHAWGRVGAG